MITVALGVMDLGAGYQVGICVVTVGILRGWGGNDDL